MPPESKLNWIQFRHQTSRETKRILMTSFIPVARPETTILPNRYTKEAQRPHYTCLATSPISSHRWVNLLDIGPLVEQCSGLWLCWKSSNSLYKDLDCKPGSQYVLSTETQGTMATTIVSTFPFEKKLDYLPGYGCLLVFQRAMVSKPCRKYVHEEACSRPIAWDPVMK